MALLKSEITGKHHEELVNNAKNNLRKTKRIHRNNITKAGAWFLRLASQGAVRTPALPSVMSVLTTSPLLFCECICDK